MSLTGTNTDVVVAIPHGVQRKATRIYTVCSVQFSQIMTIAWDFFFFLNVEKPCRTSALATFMLAEWTLVLPA